MNFFWQTKYYKITLKSNKNIPGFNNENNYKIMLEVKEGEKMYDIIAKFNNFRSPQNQISINNMKNIRVQKDITININ